ncbi:MAG: UDP-3-O-acyl-N-acetylglucosamine deacetylase [Myxococcales bacterium]|jgi:UDP-3-O-[3-hydroxymyristoyl] N-acetylglucosamine deacetylase|nr:UDP-3-O-acyl-N-acetylglucosamine deacetylase [Myxococcales bacterium]
MMKMRDMESFRQRTLAKEIGCEGIGLHTGKQVRLTFKPAPENYGITFRRTDLPDSREIPARAQYVVDTALATTLGRDGVRVSTVEHCCAALHAMGIDNLRVEVDAPEIPIFDGSAQPFVRLIQEAGIAVQRAMKSFIVIRRPVRVGDGNKSAELSPANGFSLRCHIDFRHPLISNQEIGLDCSAANFCREIASARTFGFLKDIEALKNAGLAKGGSVNNAIVVDGFSILNPEGLRFADEFVRHKALDAVGDLFLLGRPLIGHLSIDKSGHALNHQLAMRVLSDPHCYEIVSATPSEMARIEATLPAFTPAEALA